MLRSLRPFLLTFLAFSVMIASAQETCSELVQDALFAVDDFCSDLGRNQACYGNVDLTAEAQPDATDFTFEALGDVVDVEDIFSLQLSELDADANEWGVAVLSLQADIPNTLPGQNVTFILFGDVAIENASTDEQAPMQAFYLRTGIGTTDCEEAPESGLLVQTPDGVEEVTFNINGVDVQIGSTVLFSTDTSTESDELDLVLAPVEGSAAVIFDDEIYPAVEGTEIRLPISQQLLPTGRPSLPQSYDATRVAPLPIGQLPRAIGLAPPLPDANLTDLRDRVQNGLPPCGIEGLPPCENILPVLRDGNNLPPPDRWGMRFEVGVNCIQRTEADTAINQGQTMPFCPPTERDNRLAPIHALANDALELNADADGDGIVNFDDACPLRVGSEEFSGCDALPPDTDNDGVTDALDYCPYRAGAIEHGGCLDAPNDDDSDGIPNAIDACPRNAGTQETMGCPENGVSDNPESNCADSSNPSAQCPNDRDGDGIANALDDCPARPGLRENNGCPSPAQRPPNRP